VERQIQRHECERAETTEGIGRREPAFEADVCEFEFGTCSPQRYYRKKTLRAEERRKLATCLIDEHGLSERQACQTVHLHRCTYRYCAKKTDDHEIVQELQHLALEVPGQSDLTWSLDFMSDSLSTGRAIRTLNILDDYNREALWIEVDTSLPAERVIRVLETLLLCRAAPKQIRMDNGPELISQRLEHWAKEKQIELLHIQPGKPAHTVPVSLRENAYIERFNGMFREDVLDAYLFDDLEEVRTITERWLEEYEYHSSARGFTGFITPPICSSKCLTAKRVYFSLVYKLGT
jgi:transposase InsO family protein